MYFSFLCRASKPPLTKMRLPVVIILWISFPPKNNTVICINSTNGTCKLIQDDHCYRFFSWGARLFAAGDRWRSPKPSPWSEKYHYNCCVLGIPLTKFPFTSIITIIIFILLGHHMRILMVILRHSKEGGKSKKDRRAASDGWRGHKNLISY